MFDLLRILLVEDNHLEAVLLRETLAAVLNTRLEVTCAASLAEGVRRLSEAPFDAILLDLTLPDSFGLETIAAVGRAAPEVPIVALTGLADERVTAEAVRQGAQDYLMKGHVDGETMIRAIRYAIDRKAGQVALQRAHDDLERKVLERTADLARTVDELQAEAQQRQAVEAELRRANQFIRMVSECNQAMIRTGDEATLVREICRNILEVGGYRMAWVGYAEHDEAKTVRPVAWAGFEEGYLQSARISWADDEYGRGPTGTAIRTGKVQIGHDFLTDPELAPWREQALKSGYRSSMALPLSCGGQVLGAVMFYSAQPEYFDAEQTRLLQELADDLAYGIVALRTRAALEQSQQHLRQVVHSAPVMIWAIDPNGQCTLADGRLTRRDPGQGPLVGRPWQEVVGHRADVEGHIERVRGGELVTADVEFGERIFESSYSPLRDAAGNVTGVICVSTDITERRRVEREVLQAIEREQQRIGRDLHDGIQGSLAGIGMMLAALKQRAARGDGDLAEEVGNIGGMVKQTLDQTRGLARGLCPMDLMGDGLAWAFRRLADTTAGLFRVTCEFHCPLPVQIDEQTLATQLYYIGQEAVNNALKHARPGRITIRLDRRSEGVALAVEDDGVGLPEQAGSTGGMGLRTMHYRAALIGGRLSLGRRQGGGTVVACEVPVRK